MPPGGIDDPRVELILDALGEASEEQIDFVLRYLLGGDGDHTDDVTPTPA
jgi:hypothetical protein